MIKVDNLSPVLSFLSELRLNNNREWFSANKDRYLAFKSQVDAAAAAFIALVAEYEPSAAHYTPAQCTYRIYRDARFSADKSPYKTHAGIFVNPPLGKKAESMGWYLHIEPGNCFFAAGTGWSSPKVLKSLRQGIFDEIDDYREIVESPEFKAALPQLGMDCLKTAPKGFPKDWPYIDYLKPRMFGAMVSIPDAAFSSPHWLESLRPAVAQGYRFNRFCNYFVFEALGIEPENY